MVGATELFKPSEAEECLLVSIEKLESFGFELFVGDILIGVGLGFFGTRHRALAPTPMGNSLFLFFNR